MQAEFAKLGVGVCVGDIGEIGDGDLAAVDEEAHGSEGREDKYTEKNAGSEGPDEDEAAGVKEGAYAFAGGGHAVSVYREMPVQSRPDADGQPLRGVLDGFVVKDNGC